MTDESPNRTTLATWGIALVALVAASVPHFFFTAPLLLHMQGESRAWLAIAIWAPAMLAAAGFFDAGEFSDRIENEGLSRYVIPAVIGSIVVYSGFLAWQYTRLWTDMPRIPWDEMMVAFAVFGAARAIETVYWQGLFQLRLLRNQAPILRVLIVAAFSAAVWAPFALHTGLQAGLETYLVTAFVEALIVASVFELGATVRTCMILHGVLGLVYVWFQQAIFL